jgi:shikimate dehydrogenase
VSRRVALIGSPLRRPHSAVMHNAAFRHFGIDAHYDLLELAADEIATFVETARGAEWMGFQVTAPYKRRVGQLVDRVEPEAERIGAVNSVERRLDGTLAGFNTDAPGWAMSVERDLGRRLAGAAVAVAGAGGAARAVVSACLVGEVDRVTVGSRRPEAAAELAEATGDERVQSAVLGDDFDDVLRETDLAVNATTVGMVDPGVPFDPRLLPDRAAVFDLVYVPAETELIAHARERGLPAVNGLGMLVAQADLAFTRWTGVSGASHVMRTALEELAT